MTSTATSWVADRFGVQLLDDGTGKPPSALVELGLRRNPRRAHLLVSGVLGKHVPVDPQTVRDTAFALGAEVAEWLDGEGALVLGFAETATGLGHLVAESLGADYLHSTRRQVTTARPLAGFREDHSHATDHLLLPDDPGFLDRAETLVLVDDELSSGRTAMNIVSALQALSPRRRYVIAALVDLRPPTARAELDSFAASLGVRIEVVSLASGRVELPPDLTAEVSAVADRPAPPPFDTDADVRIVAPAWPAHVREGGRHGFTAADARGAAAAAAQVARAVEPSLIGSRVLVLASEELMYAPISLALALSSTERELRVSSTTRSPILVLDEPDYPVRSVIGFDSHDHPVDGPGRRFAYNLAGAFDGRPADDIVLVLDDDSDADAAGGLLAGLRRQCRRLHVVTLPCHRPLPEPLRGPQFGSYAADEVGWLLTDLSRVALEAPTDEREEAIQSGAAHYAESLPVEFQPDARYLAVFEAALDDSAARIAHAVGVVTEIVLAERGPGAVLVSLARAGTPVGVLLRRWAAFAHGLDVPHHTMSIVRGRGIDTVALCWLAAHHDPRDVVFVDGWTGKGAISRELAAAIGSANDLLGTAFDPALAVLADPGRCASTFGTREDFLVPSACLNSTVSGLVSRTVLNGRVLAPGQFHGAKYYAELAGADVSARFLDAISDRFAEVAPAVARDWPAVREGDRRPTWQGWAEVERIGAEFGIDDVTLIKPGVGETTRVLLRRVPWQVLARAGVGAPEHVRLLAEQRGVPVREVDGLGFRCVGLIRPRR